MQRVCDDCGRDFEAQRTAARFCSPACRQRAKRKRDSGGAPQALKPQKGGAGPVERTVRADIGAMMTAHPAGEALAEMSYALARQLDAGAGMVAAAVNRELRANLIELSRLAVDDSDELADELSAPELPAEIRDPEDS